MARTLLRFLLALLPLCEALAASPRAYVSNEGSESIAMIDTGTDRIVESISTAQKPRGIAVSLDGTSLAVAVEENDVVARW